ncbi:MAG: hypothetical protein VKJ24_10950 [Synechococcales bacterium]|nr:hypothetical protein [Synechococcales bacterium]
MQENDLNREMTIESLPHLQDWKTLPEDGATVNSVQKSLLGNQFQQVTSKARSWEDATRFVLTESSIASQWFQQRLILAKQLPQSPEFNRSVSTGRFQRVGSNGSVSTGRFQRVKCRVKVNSPQG